MKNNSVSCNHVFIQSQFIRFFFLLLVILFFNYCTEERPTEQTEVKSKISLSKTNSGGTKINFSVTSDSTKKDSTKTKDGTIIEPYAQNVCQKTEHFWILEKYENVPGKIVGIWPTWERWGNVQRLKQLKDTLGFNYMFTYLGWPYDKVVAAGYTMSNLLGGLALTGYVEASQSRPPLWGYYIDEPISHQKGTVSQVEAWTNFLGANFPYSIRIAGENTESNADLINHTVDLITCTRYDNYPEWYDPDQRSLWTNFREHFNAQFDMVWIGAHKDLSQYDDLIGHARNLGIPEIWLYQHEDSTDHYSNNNVGTFAYYAWKWGFLKRVEREWVYYYDCIHQDPCNCDPGDPAGWYVTNKVALPNTRTIDY